MGHAEIELKFPLADPSALRARLAALGAIDGGAVFEENVVFDEPSGRLQARDELLRVRSAERAVVTYKAPRAGDPRFKVREEIEFEVSDAAAACAVFARLGFTRTRRYQKRRQTWRLGAAVVLLDELPFGTYCEIEGPPEAIAAAAARLELDLRQGLRQDYFALYDELCRAQGRPTGEDIVFPSH
jgi:adenylate cyclase class 2